VASSAERLEHARSVLAESGLVLSDGDRLAVPPRRVAQLLSISPSMVGKLIASGELPAFRAGRSVRVQLIDLVEFMDRNQRVAAQRDQVSLRARAMALLDGR